MADAAKRNVIAAAIGYAVDGFDLLILSFLLPFIAADLALSPTRAGSLMTATLLGAVAGGILFGIASDRLGRVRVLNWTILTFAAFTGACALAAGYWDLLVYRTLAGFGLGGEFGIGMALAAEASPPALRARMSSYVALGWQAGVLAAALLAPALLPLIGWRGMFAMGVLPALAAYGIRRFAREPVIRRLPSASATLGFLVDTPPARRMAFGILILCSVQNFGYFGLMIWLPGYLSSQFGYNFIHSALWMAVTVLGMAAGIVAFGYLADRVGRKPSFALYQCGAIAMLLVYAQLSSPLALLFGGAAMGFFVNGMMGGYGALIAECYPAHHRATAQNALFNLGRAIGGLGPLAVGWISGHYSPLAVILLLVSAYLLDMAATLCLLSEKKAQPLT